MKKIVDVRQILREKAPHLAGKLPSFIINYLIKIVHEDEVNFVLNSYCDKDGIAFMDALMDYFDIRLNVYGEDCLPDSSRLVFVSNHPLGGLDGVCISSVLGRRYDGRLRVPVNDLLLFIPNLRSIFIPVNKHGRQDRRAALLTEETFASDNHILTFPAGMCSRKMRGEIVDLPWKKSFLQKAVEHKRDIVPMFFDGKNSDFFYRLANVRKRFGIKANVEMLYLSDELFKSKHSSFGIYFGRPMSWTMFDKSRTPGEWTEEIRKKVYSLKGDFIKRTK
ncbi:MAG: 1-acyl-sn-glycerol-3-phosphate acyltransferase [Tannerellaceae bacterium]|nr:1-acyl-sn-glycerol-3-phosphate acyltransferase [Tannerellaceae bacterium]